VGATGGWVSVSGLRASKMRNLEDVLLGEAMTAARDVAEPCVGAGVLARPTETHCQNLLARRRFARVYTTET
jgi:hypothetical protein